MSIEHKRACHAMAIVERLRNENLDNYVSYVKALPATILQNGLGQAMATLLAQSTRGEDDDHRLLYDHLKDWLCRENTLSAYYGQGDLMQAIINNDETAYMHAQAEALAYLEWLKKFAVAYLSAPEPDIEEDAA